MLRVEERSPGSSDETGYVLAYQNVKSRLSFVHEDCLSQDIQSFKITVSPFISSIWINRGFEPCRLRGFLYYIKLFVRPMNASIRFVFIRADSNKRAKSHRT